MRMHYREGTLLGVGYTLLLVSTGEAVTRRVPSEYATIQAGMDASAFGDTVLVAPGVYTDYEVRDLGTVFPWTACVFLVDGVVLRSESGPEVTVIDMSKASGPQLNGINGMNAPSAGTVLDGFAITEGSGLGRGVLLVSTGDVLIKNCAFRDLDASVSNGGGVLILGYATIENCTFRRCYSDGSGGAIYHSNGHLDLIGCDIRECESPAVRLDGVGGGPMESAYIADCTFIDNVATAGAGAITCGLYFGGVTVTGCYFRNNVNYGAGGGALDFGAGNRLIEKCVFISNGALASNGQGGAIGIGGSGLCVVRENTFLGNYKTPTSSAGAAVAFYANASFENNIVAKSTGGGAVFDSINSTLITGCNVFWMNQQGNGVPFSPTDREVDPLFCDLLVEDLTLREGSPCLPEDPLGCGLIGALGMGCGTVSVQSMSWGKIKEAYRQAQGARP